MSDVDIFLRESNFIENEYSDLAFEGSVVAWKYAVLNYNNWGIEYIKNIHEKLMCNLNSNIAGKLRRRTVYIVGRDSLGNSRVVQEILAKGNKTRLRKWCNDYSNIESLDEIKEAHIDFEMIHPFLDGNGRTGRILYNTQRINAGFDVKIFYEKEKSEYYKWFKDRQTLDRLSKLISELE